VRSCQDHANSTGDAPLYLHVQAGHRLTAELAEAAPGRVRQVADALGVVRRYREIAAWLLSHPDPAIARRLAVMAPQAAELIGARRRDGGMARAAPPALRYRFGPVAPGCCLSCGDPLGPADDGPTRRCRPCRVATQLALVRVLEGVPAYASMPITEAAESGGGAGA
jgi:hypothetical protein